MADYVGLEARLIVGCFFAIAGMAKILRPELGHATVVYGVSGRFRPVIRFLPFLEFGLGALLITGLLLRPAAVVALALVAILSIFVARSVIKGAEGGCHCWGGLLQARLSWETMLRNLSLIMLLALVVIVQVKVVQVMDLPPALFMALALVMVYLLFIRVLGLEYEQ